MSLAELSVGDKVLVDHQNTLAYEPVLSFIHRISAGKDANFLIIEHTRGKLRVSSNHVIFVNSKDGRSEKLASDIKVDDEIFAIGSEEAITTPSKVTSIRTASNANGMFAPLTPSGSIVVDGVVASNYASVAAHNAAHAFFFPARLYHYLGLETFVASVPAANDPDVLHPWATIVHNQYFQLHKLMSHI